MSVSIDDEAAEGGEDSRSVLESWLDDYSEGRCDLEDVQDSFLSVCRSDPDAPWDALALLDQYTRRGRIEARSCAVAEGGYREAGVRRCVPRRTSARNRPPSRSRDASNARRLRTTAAPIPPDSTSDLTTGSSQHAHRDMPHRTSGRRHQVSRWRKRYRARRGAIRPATVANVDRRALRRTSRPVRRLSLVSELNRA